MNINIKKISGETDDYKVLTAFENSEAKYIVVDSKTIDNNGYAITLTARVNGTELEMIEKDSDEWKTVKTALVGIVKEQKNVEYFQPENQYGSSVNIGQNLALKEDNYNSIVNDYLKYLNKDNTQTIEEQPVIEEAPVVDTPAVDVPVVDTPVAENVVEDIPTPEIIPEIVPEDAPVISEEVTPVNNEITDVVNENINSNEAVEVPFEETPIIDTPVSEEPIVLEEAPAIENEEVIPMTDAMNMVGTEDQIIDVPVVDTTIQDIPVIEDIKIENDETPVIEEPISLDDNVLEEPNIIEPIIMDEQPSEEVSPFEIEEPIVLDEAPTIENEEVIPQGPAIEIVAVDGVPVGEEQEVETPAINIEAVNGIPVEEIAKENAEIEKLTNEINRLTSENTRLSNENDRLSKQVETLTIENSTLIEKNKNLSALTELTEKKLQDIQSQIPNVQPLEADVARVREA